MNKMQWMKIWGIRLLIKLGIWRPETDLRHL